MNSTASLALATVPEYPVELSSPPQSPIYQSNLSITATIESPPTFSPAPTPKSASFQALPLVFSEPPPSLPPKWLWSCHICGTAYPLGTTRRCLNDGHYFCAGVSISKKTGRKKTHTPCGSTFDYIGWQAYGDWRRHEIKLQSRAENRSISNTASSSSTNPRANRVSSCFSKLAHSRGGTEEMQSDSSEEDPIATDTSSPPGSTSSTATVPGNRRSCERDCNYPSECRWRHRELQSPVTTKREQKKKREIVKGSISRTTAVAQPNSPSSDTITRRTPSTTADSDGIVQANDDVDNTVSGLLGSCLTNVLRRQASVKGRGKDINKHQEQQLLRQQGSLILPIISIQLPFSISGFIYDDSHRLASESLLPLNINTSTAAISSLSTAASSSSSESGISSSPSSIGSFTLSTCRAHLSTHMLIPGLIPEPLAVLRSVDPIEKAGYVGEDGCSRLGNEYGRGHGGSVVRQAQRTLEWDWSVGGLTHVFDRRFGMHGERIESWSG